MAIAEGLLQKQWLSPARVRPLADSDVLVTAQYDGLVRTALLKIYSTRSVSMSLYSIQFGSIRMLKTSATPQKR